MFHVKPETPDADQIRAPEVIAITGVTYRQLEYWWSQGWLGTGRVGSGRSRTFTSRDVAVITYALALIGAGLMAAPAVATAARLVDTGRPVPLVGGLIWVYPALQPHPEPRPATTADTAAADPAAALPPAITRGEPEP